jgi:hypothetical protein
MMRFRLASLALAFFVMRAAGCSDSTRSTVPTTVLNGMWQELGQVVGSSEVWTLMLSGSAIAGTGTWTAEACCGGTLAITGTVDDNGVHLDIAPVSQVGGAPGAHPPAHFDGTLLSARLLQGMFGGDAERQVQFQR